MQPSTRIGLAAIGVGIAGVVVREVAAVTRLVRGSDGGERDHTATVGGTGGPPLRLVLLGDSAVDGYGLTSGDALPRQLASRLAARTDRPVQVRSVARSGARTRDVVAEQLPLLRAAGDADLVVVGVGVNDAIRATRAGEVAAGTEALVRGVAAAAPQATLVVLVCPDLRAAPGLGPVLRRLLGARCRAVQRAQVAALSGTAARIVTHPAARPDALGADGLHPGSTGIAELAVLTASVATA